MKAAYADPPYLGCGKLYVKHHPDALIWDDPETHRALIVRLSDEFEAWALSLHTSSLQTIIAMCPPDVRVGSWVKPFCSFKPGVNVAFAWEPVIFRGGRKRGRYSQTVRDYCSANMTMKQGMPGAKPEVFAFWVFDLLGLENGDEFHDLFPGSGAVTRAWERYRRQLPLPMWKTRRPASPPLAGLDQEASA
jgi:hypothetical protein